ncbi:hypothetical protein ACFLYF_04280, partial [Chloroflexota bacterium]
IPIVITILILFCSLLVACVSGEEILDTSDLDKPQSTSDSPQVDVDDKPGPGSSKDSKDSTEPYKINVFLNDTLVSSLTGDDLKSLEQLSITVKDGNRNVKGPSLISVINLAGISDFNEVHVFGLAKRRAGPADYVIENQQTATDSVLVFNNSGKTKLAGIDLPWDVVIDVSELRVR